MQVLSNEQWKRTYIMLKCIRMPALLSVKNESYILHVFLNSNQMIFRYGPLQK